MGMYICNLIKEMEFMLCTYNVYPVQVGNGSDSPYKFPNLTAEYIVKWVLGAKKYYNLDIDYVGVRLNETETVRYSYKISCVCRFGMNVVMTLHTSRQHFMS